MVDFDKPFDLENQIISMKKYVVFSKKNRIRNLLSYTGYFRLSRYGKYLLSYTSILKTKPNQELLFEVYKFDAELRKLLFTYCKKAEIQFKSNLSNAVSLKLEDPLFYLDKNYYTPTRGESDKKKRDLNKKYFPKFFDTLIKSEKELRRNAKKYPDLKEYRTGGNRFSSKVPSWAAFSSFEFGTITNIYSYLRGDLRKEVLIYGYSRKNYGKKTTQQMDTWLDAIRNLRNICAHHNILVGRTSSVVLIDADKDDANILTSGTDLFSRIYALRKILKYEDGISLKKDISKLIKKTKFDIHQFDILPLEWENHFDRIESL